MAKKAKTTELIEVQAIDVAEITMRFLGKSPTIMNRFSAKAWQELLFPSIKQNRAGLEQSLKHDPFAEFRGACYVNKDPKSKTLIHLPSGSFHGAMAAAALDLPGAAKAKIERLTKIVDITIELYGIPQIFCAMVRNSDMNHTPDVRTRPIFPEWAGELTVQYVKGIISERTVANLMGAAGLINGIGDWRGQKGGPFGSFEIVGSDNKDWHRIVKTQGRTAQEKAFRNPAFYDENTEELLIWFEQEVANREMEAKLGDGGKRKTNGKPAPRGPIYVEKSANGGGELVGVE